ncbi:MAG: lipase family protein [Bacteroidota bacterium]
MKNIFLLFFFVGVSVASSYSQVILKPGFDAKEYLQMLDVFQLQNDTAAVPKMPASVRDMQHLYQSPELGLLNRFDIWLRPDKVGIICIRGTIPKPNSWIENFYSAMIPAIGSLQLNDTTTFNYKLAADSGAKVHVGWTLGLGHMMPSMVKQINNLYEKGVKEIIIFGHSQGAALAFLTRSYLQYADGVAKNIFYKTYASAAPKPGDLNYAYDFDFITRGGWGMRVVNNLDWVPETPFSIQTLKDWNQANPFINLENLTGEQKWIVKWYLNSVVNKMDRSTRKAMERYQKYLGKKIGGMVKKSLKEYSYPQYANSMNYMTTGTPVILMANGAYKAKYVFNGKNIFVHHLLGPYRFLVNTHYPAQ